MSRTQEEWQSIFDAMTDQGLVRVHRGFSIENARASGQYIETDKFRVVEMEDDIPEVIFFPAGEWMKDFTLRVKADRPLPDGALALETLKGAPAWYVLTPVAVATGSRGAA